MVHIGVGLRCRVCHQRRDARVWTYRYNAAEIKGRISPTDTDVVVVDSLHSELDLLQDIESIAINYTQMVKRSVRNLAMYRFTLGVLAIRITTTPHLVRRHHYRLKHPKTHLVLQKIVRSPKL